MGSNLWGAYVRAVVPSGERQVDTAEKTGLTQSTISRWTRGQAAPTEAAQVAALAQAYRRNVIEAFVAAGFLTEREAAGGLPSESRAFLAKVRRSSAISARLTPEEAATAGEVGRRVAAAKRPPARRDDRKDSRFARRSTN